MGKECIICEPITADRGLHGGLAERRAVFVSVEGEAPCTVHGLFQRGEEDGSGAGPVMVIEYDDGRLDEVAPEQIRMTDKCTPTTNP